MKEVMCHNEDCIYYNHSHCMRNCRFINIDRFGNCMDYKENPRYGEIIKETLADETNKED